MGGLIRLWVLRAAPYLVRLFWPSCASAVLIWLGIHIVLDALGAQIDREMALVLLAGIGLGLASCLLWAIGSVREYHRAEAPHPHL
ncbi:hypothetical protein LO763_11620 [Glycomyces sp. A-F 0318]|uniref:hypothetical protein n=1 Tax=Glycomyces amatae TaxID=2881355 RepID=UPI001E48C4CD|nr:hypothetical protein [Glycomyces amatae]MCD0444270.1 hypothetical protein [Glycomyces amatae]